jgi:DNA-binding LacI/PurR family transcriptional regulator
VFVCGDLVAIGVIAELRARGLRVPEDVAVVGSDGVEFGRYVAPALTTAGMLMFESARRAAQLLLGTISGEIAEAQHVRTPIEFWIGQSCGYRLEHPNAPALIRTDDNYEEGNA